MTASVFSPQRYSPVGMVVIYDATLAASAASFDVQNLPQGYKHLKVEVYGRTSDSSDRNINVRFNNDSGNNYDMQYITAAHTTVNGSGVVSQSSAQVGLVPGTAGGASRVGNGVFDVLDYANTTFFKSTVGVAMRSDGTAVGDQRIQVVGSTWRSTSAINRITVLPSAGDWIAGSRLTIYGLGGAPQIPDPTGDDLFYYLYAR